MEGFYGLWNKKCEICGKNHSRKIKPVINIFLCCNRTHKWEKVD